MRAALLLSLLACCIAAVTSRGVNWYVASSNVNGNAALLEKHGDAISGAYLCCNFIQFQPNGTLTQRYSDADSSSQISVFTSAFVETWAVGGVAEAAIHTGSWQSGLAEVARVSKLLLQDGLMGIIIDYEPADNYTQSHAAAYGEFLGALSAAIAPLRVGMDIAGWGILGPSYWPAFMGRGVSRFTSMTPTYDATNVTADEVFVAAAQAFFPPGAYAVGVGSVLAEGHTCGGGDFKWRNDTLPPFIDSVRQQSVEYVDVWRCDIDTHYGVPDDLTAPFFFDALAGFLA